MSLSDYTTEELAKELVRRGTSFAGNKRLVKWNDNSHGSFFRVICESKDDDGTIILHENPFKGCKEGLKDGQRLFITATMVSEKELNDSPLPPLENSGPDSSLMADCNPATTNEAGREPRKWVDMLLSQRAALLTKDREFLRFYGLPSEEAADRMIKSQCEIFSKAELDLPDTEELTHKKDVFRGLEKKFLDWRQEQRITQGRDYL